MGGRGTTADRDGVKEFSYGTVLQICQCSILVLGPMVMRQLLNFYGLWILVDIQR